MEINTLTNVINAILILIIIGPGHGIQVIFKNLLF